MHLRRSEPFRSCRWTMHFRTDAPPLRFVRPRPAYISAVAELAADSLLDAELAVTRYCLAAEILEKPSSRHARRPCYFVRCSAQKRYVGGFAQANLNDHKRSWKFHQIDTLA